MSAEPRPAEPTGPAPVPLLMPADGVPPVIADATALAPAVAAFATARGPVAVDAERASGYRYSQRAYLVQLRRAGAGTALVDPVGCPDLAPLSAALRDAEWVLHAANQDLACLAEVGLRPGRVFDTELAGRLLGYPHVALGTLTEQVLGIHLEKGFSAANWSTRPLPHRWLVYAALDVELLVDLRDALEKQLAAADKLGWAREEFAALLTAPPRSPRADPWRRTSGIHRVHDPRQLAVVRELWATRDEVARDADLAPGRVLPDAAIVDLALRPPDSSGALAARPAFRARRPARSVPAFWSAVERARRLPATDLPGGASSSDGPPAPRSWARRDPAAAARLGRSRGAVAELAERHGMPAENLLAPDAVRRLAWTPPSPLDPAAVGAELRRLGARAWQVELTAGPLATALAKPAR